MRKFVLVFLSLFLVIGCAKTPLQQQQTSIEEAKAAIDKQDYDKALTILLTLDKSDTIRDLLATAYAGRAGFNAAKIADMITTNEDPLRILYSLSNKYTIQNILDSQNALSQIYSSKPNSYGGSDSNLKYASIQVYKISQILVKNYIRYGRNDVSTEENWSPCSDLELAGIDLRDIIISVNRAALAAKTIEADIYNYLISLQKQLNIDPNLFEDEVIKNTDVTNARLSISKEYSKYIGQENDQEYSCDSTSSTGQ